METALSDIFFTGYFKAEGGPKKASYQYIDTVLTYTAEKGTFDEVLDRSTERWTQSTMGRGACAARALSSSCFMRPVATFVRTRKDEATYKWLLLAKAQGFPKPSNVHFWALSAPPFSRDETDRGNYCRNKHKSHGPNAKDR